MGKGESSGSASEGVLLRKGEGGGREGGGESSGSASEGVLLRKGRQGGV